MPRVTDKGDRQEMSARISKFDFKGTRRGKVTERKKVGPVRVPDSAASGIAGGEGGYQTGAHTCPVSWGGFERNFFLFASIY